MEKTETSGEKQSSKTEHIKPWQFKKGQSGNPLGRPPGRSLKDRAKAYLAGLSDEEAVEFFVGIDKKTVWEMAEGKPKQDTEANVKVEMPTPILNLDVLRDNSNEETSETGEED